MSVAREGRNVETRLRLLEVAEAEFATKGYAGAHLQGIASEVGVQKTALYYYFESKADLYLAVLDRMLGDFQTCVASALERDLPHRERLMGFVDEVGDLMAERRNYSQILIRIFVDNSGVDLDRLAPVIRDVIGSVLALYREGVDAGAFRKLSARHAFQSLLGAIVFHYAARDFSTAVVGVDDLFSRDAVAWRREELRSLLRDGVIVPED